MIQQIWGMIQDGLPGSAGGKPAVYHPAKIHFTVETWKPCSREVKTKTKTLKKTREINNNREGIHLTAGEAEPLWLWLQKWRP